MKTLKPLAAAFLLLASSASAQLLNPAPAGGGFSLTSGNGGNSNLLSFANTNGSGPIPDASFTCSSMENVHIPFASCTKEQLDDRKRFNGECSAKSTACKEYLQRTLSGANPAGTIAAYTPPPGREWASPTCQRVPCALADEPEEIVVTAPRSTPGPTPRPDLPYDQQPGFIGPPSPFNTPVGANNAGITTGPNPPAPNFDRAFADAKKEHGDKAIDLGNKTYGILDDKDGTITVVGPNGSVKKDQSEYRDKIQQARAEANNYTGTSGGGTPPPSSNKTGGQNSGGTAPPANDDSGSSGGGGSLGRSFASDQASISGAGADGDSSGGSSGGGASTGDGKGYIAVKPSEMQAVGSIQITHTALLKTEADIISAQKAFTNGQTGFAAPNDDTGSAAGDPPISPEHLGKIQAVENGPAQK